MTEMLRSSAKPFPRRLLAGVLDLVTVFGIGGYAIHEWSASLQRSGYQLNDAPILMTIALASIYFYLGWNHYDGTIWQRILKAR